MRQLTFKLKKGVKFDVERVLSQLKSDYPIPADPQPEDYYFTGDMNTSEKTHNDGDGELSVSITMSKEPNGWDKEGNHEAASDAETLQAYMDGLDENSDEATKYLSREEKQSLLKRAKDDAASKTWDTLTAEQKKVAMNADLSLTETDQLAIDFPEV